MMRQTSRTDTVCSYQSGSMHRVHLITEASSVLPSLSISAFSLDIISDNSEGASSIRDVLGPAIRFEEGLSSSCKDGLDIFDDPNYTDTVKSNDSTGSILRRSLSVPPKYTYKGHVRKHVLDVFEDFIVRDDTLDDSEKDEDSPRTWRQTMEDLLERPEYIDSLQSTSSGTALLAKSAIHITQKGAQAHVVKDERSRAIQQKKEECHMYIKNLIVLSISWFFVFGAYLSLRNVQSSINSDSALALYSLSALYLCFFLGCITATTIIQFLRPKNTMLIGISSVLLYIGTNFYPTYYTLFPASLLVGFSLASIWTAHSTYLASIALCYAKASGKNANLVLAKFNGIFYMLFGVSQVLGNIISSTVLMNQADESVKADKTTLSNEYNGYNDNDTFTYNDSLSKSIEELVTQVASNVSTAIISPHTEEQCGIKYIRDVSGASSSGSGASAAIDKHIVFILLFIFTIFVLVGMALLSFSLDRLDGEIKKSSKSVGDQLMSVFRWFNDYRVLCLTPLMFYSLIQIAFIFGEFSMAFVTCPMGVYMVGYSMVALSVFTSLSSYISGKIVKHVGRVPVFCAAGLIQFVLLITMCFWKPTSDSTILLLAFMGFWGIGDGIWLTQVVSIIGILFADNKEPAFAGVKMCQSLGACLTLVTAKYVSFEIKVYIIASLLVVSIAGYLLLELTLCRQERSKANDTEKPDVSKNGPTSV